ncbi:MAG TPA: SdrD B-like domain-containing protein [Gemmataceae bacterium]|jgi:hypothetical protein
MMELRVQLIATIEQDISNAFNTLGQDIAQAVASAQQQWDRMLGINPSPANPSLNTTVSQPSSANGTGQGSDSGVTATGNGSTTGLGNLTAKPMTGGGGVNPTGGGTNPTANPGGPTFGTGIVSGQVWDDNNGDGVEDDGEGGLAGINVQLWALGQPGTSAEQMGTTTTNSGGNYQFTVSMLSPSGYQSLEVIVGIPTYDWTTFEGADSQINIYGESPVFALTPGGAKVIPAGIASMNVNTAADDPNANQVVPGNTTLRDAIETGNNGNFDPYLNYLSNVTPAVTFYTDQQGDQLGGTISLQAALPPIEADYDIDGPGASTLAVSGANSFGVFNVEATSAISGLTIENGSNGNGGGVLNNGNLTLNGDTIKSNQTTGNGGGIDNDAGSLTLSGDQILGNSSTGAGGGLYNAGGMVTIAGGTVFKTNKAQGGQGGGICNASGTVTLSGGTVINSNATSASGGGVANSGTFLMTGGQISQNFMLPGGSNGGGVFNKGSMRLLGVQVQGNLAVRGGGIYTNGKLVLGNTTTISGNNWASVNGGGMYVAGGTAAMLGGGVTNNTAEQSGGGIYVLSGQLMLKNGVQVSSNTAVGNGGGGRGGGIYLLDGTVTMSSGKVFGNRASDSGGGIYNLGGTLTLDDSVNIQSNGATNLGGGIYLATQSTTTFDSAVVFDNQTNGAWMFTGWGVYWQNNATVNLPNLADPNDPGGNPVKGP